MKRIIPIVQIQNRKGVKTIKGKSPTYVGCPVNAVKIFSDSNASEILISDIAASKSSIIDFDFLSKISEESYVPLSYIGGISSLSDFDRLFNLGFEKVGCEKLIIENPQIVKSAINKYGSSSVFGSITCRKSIFNRYYCAPYNKKSYKIEFKEYLKTITSLPLGEIIINNVNVEGTLEGSDLFFGVELLKKLKIPVIYSGGICSKDEVLELINIPYISGVALGSLCLFASKKRGVLINYPSNIAPHLN